MERRRDIDLPLLKERAEEIVSACNRAVGRRGPNTNAIFIVRREFGKIVRALEEEGRVPVLNSRRALWSMRTLLNAADCKEDAVLFDSVRTFQKLCRKADKSLIACPDEAKGKDTFSIPLNSAGEKAVLFLAALFFGGILIFLCVNPEDISPWHLLPAGGLFLAFASGFGLCLRCRMTLRRSERLLTVVSLKKAVFRLEEIRSLKVDSWSFCDLIVELCGGETRRITVSSHRGRLFTRRYDRKLEKKLETMIAEIRRLEPHFMESPRSF